MEVIGFLYVSLGSSTVQLRESLCSRGARTCSEAGFNRQNGYQGAAFCCAFLWAKGLNAKDIHKELFPLYLGKCLSRKAVHNWVVNVSLMTKRLKEVWK
jgi:hypothetical protein